MRSTRCLAVLSLSILFVASTAPSALADDNDNTQTNPYLTPSLRDDSYRVDIAVGQARQSVTGPGTPTWLRECRWDAYTVHYVTSFLWEPASNGGNQTPPTEDELRAQGIDPDEPWTLVTCPSTPESIAAAPQIQFRNVLATWRIGERPPQLMLDYLIARAYASVELPTTTGTSSPPGDTTIPMITQLPTWLWVSDTTWNANYTATTPPLYGTTATVTATPINVTFEADNQTIDCANNTGTPYDLTKDEDDQTTNCSLTYNHASVPADHYLQATITWTATYTCNQYCGTGTLPNYTITTRRPVTVEQRQVINSYNNSNQ